MALSGQDRPLPKKSRPRGLFWAKPRRIHPPRVPSSPMKKVGVVVSLVVAVLVGCAAQTPSAVAPPPAAMLVTPQSTGVPPPAAPVASATQTRCLRDAADPTKSAAPL